MRYLLDTPTVLWMLADRRQLGETALALIQDSAEGDLAISDITLLEISMLLNKGRIAVNEAEISFLEGLERKLNVLGIDARIATDAMSLPLPQADPFDRIIVATARRHDLSVITGDKAIRESGCVETAW